MDNEKSLIWQICKLLTSRIAWQRERFAEQHLDKLGLCAIHKYPHRCEETEDRLILIQEVVLVPLGKTEIGPYAEAAQVYPHQAFRAEIARGDARVEPFRELIGITDGGSLNYSTVQAEIFRRRLEKFKL